MEFKHNVGHSPRRSLTHIGDGILVSSESKIQRSLSEYITLVTELFGPEGVNQEKVKWWPGALEAIGWEFDFVTWRV